MKRRLHIPVGWTGIIALLAFAPVSSRGAIPTGPLSYTITDAANCLWDASTVSELKDINASVSRISADINFYVDFTQNGSGKLSGFGLTDVRVASPDISGTLTNAGYRVYGSVSSKNGVTRLQFTAVASTTAFFEGHRARLTATAIRTATVASGYLMTGTYKNRAALSPGGSATASGPLPFTWSDIAPEVGDGSWVLNLDIHNDGAKALTGNASVRLKSGAHYEFYLKGNYNPKTDASRITLSPQPSSKGSTLKLGMVGSNISSLRGRISGQTVNWIPAQ